MTTSTDSRSPLRRALADQRAGRLEEAEVAYRRALAEEPGDADAVHLLGMLYQQTGRDEEALRLLERAAELDPSAPNFHANLGSLLGRLGRAAEAVDCFERALRLKLDYPEAWLNLGVALGKLGRHEDSVEALREATRRRPGYAEARHQLGEALRKVGRPADALAEYREAVRLKPDWPEPLAGLAGACGELGLLAEATVAHRKVVELCPHSPSAGSDYLHLLHYDPAVSRQELLDEAKRWASRHAEPFARFIRPPAVSAVEPPAVSAVEPHANDRSPDRPLRIGYVSGDFHEHPVARLIEPVLANLDRSQFQTFCYHTGRQVDEMTGRIKAVAGTWREAAGMRDEDLADLIRRDKIDILVDLAGQMGGHRLTLFARRPAPVQVTHFNYPDTTGMSQMDWRVSDDVAEPEGPIPCSTGVPPVEDDEGHRRDACATGAAVAANDCHDGYSTERLLRLPRRAWCYQPTDDGPEVGPLPALSSGYVTFCSLNKPLKHSAPCVALWARVLAAAPGSKLMLLGFADASQNEPMARQFAAHGVGPERLAFVTRRPRRRYLDLYNGADLGLDPFPYNGGVTSCDSLWMGVPFVALEGNSYLSRQGLMLLTNIGLSKLVAKTEEPYVRIAAGVAGNLDWLAKARSRLRERLRQSPICDGPAFARDLGDAYRRAWREWNDMRNDGRHKG